jgi:hypothetical protein
MTIQHLSEAKTIARAATSIGAQLPEQITAALAHLEDIARDTPKPLRPGNLATELAQHLGNPAAMDKAFKASAAKLATADAASKIYAYLTETCGTRVRGMMRAHSEEVAAAFGEALADDLATLEASASRLPAWFNPTQAASLDPDTFKAWTQARDAYARIQSASAALTPLYAGAIGHDNASQFPIAAAASLRFAKPPALSTKREAYAVRDALQGRTERTQGLAGQGSTFVDGLFIPTALAHVGATFEWATPAEVTERSEVIVNGMVREPVMSR